MTNGLERRRLPPERPSVTHRFVVGGYEGFFTVGMYEDGKPGEMFVHVSKEGSTVSGLLDCLAVSVSLGLQHGIPIEKYVEKFSSVRFEPMGRTENPGIPEAESIVDYIFRWIGKKFIDGS